MSESVSTDDLDRLISEQTGIGWIVVEEDSDLKRCVARSFEYQLTHLEDEGHWRFSYVDTASDVEDSLIVMDPDSVLDELAERRDELEDEVASAQEEYDQLTHELGVEGYGHIDYQFRVEGREDIDESDVEAVSEAEDKPQDVKQKLNGVKAKMQDLERDLN